MTDSSPKLFLSILLSGLLTFASCAAADENSKSNTKIIKEGSIEIITSDDSNQNVLIFDLNDLEDEATLQEKLSHLSQDKQDKVKQILSDIELDRFSSAVTVGDMSSLHDLDIIVETDGKVNKEVKHVWINRSDNEGDVEVLKDVERVFTFNKGISANHIEKMIQRGEFTKEELKQLQRALDEKW